MALGLKEKGLSGDASVWFSSRWVRERTNTIGLLHSKVRDLGSIVPFKMHAIRQESLFLFCDLTKTTAINQGVY
jgi:hypothetical protein